MSSGNMKVQMIGTFSPFRGYGDLKGCAGMTQRDGMGREVGGGSGWGTCVQLWQMRVDVWQNQYNIVK